MNDIIRAVVLLWPGRSSFVRGNPGYSQSQGMVEQGNRTIQMMISARELDENICCWSKWLPEIQCKQQLKFICDLSACVFVYNRNTSN